MAATVLDVLKNESSPIETLHYNFLVVGEQRLRHVQGNHRFDSRSRNLSELRR